MNLQAQRTCWRCRAAAACRARARRPAGRGYAAAAGSAAALLQTRVRNTFKQKTNFKCAKYTESSHEPDFDEM